MARSQAKLFKTRLFGYRRQAVDAHLATVDAAIAELQAKVEAASTPEHQDLVLRATRLSVEAAIEEAQAEGARIRSAAQAEAAALLADAYELAHARKSIIDLRDEEAALFDDHTADISSSTD